MTTAFPDSWRSQVWTSRRTNRAVISLIGKKKRAEVRIRPSGAPYMKSNFKIKKYRSFFKTRKSWTQLIWVIKASNCWIRIFPFRICPPQVVNMPRIIQMARRVYPRARWITPKTWNRQDIQTRSCRTFSPITQLCSPNRIWSDRRCRKTITKMIKFSFVSKI